MTKLTHYILRLLLFILIPLSLFANTRLSLDEAIAIALHDAPELKQLKASKQALEYEAIASGQLPDPMLNLGIQSVPVDNFNLQQEAMTQWRLGLSQTFPKGRTLSLQTEQQTWLARAEFEKLTALEQQIILEVRTRWTELYYWLKASDIIKQQKSIFDYLLQVTESQLANNQIKQKDLLRTQYELGKLDNQLISIEQSILNSRAQLARWIGSENARIATPTHLPHFTPPYSLEQLENNLETHPELRSDSALITASNTDVKIAKQQFLPGFSLGVNYGLRQGKDAMGQKRSNLISGEVAIDLPIFPRNRQSKHYKASQERALSQHEARESNYRLLRQRLQEQYANWQKLQASVVLYKQTLIPLAEDYASATLIAYQNNQTEFAILADSYIEDLETKLEALLSEVSLTLAHAELLYIQGD